MKDIVIFVVVAVVELRTTGADSTFQGQTNSIQITPAYLNQFADEMRTNNPGLHAADARAAAAEANANAVRTWEDPMLRVGGMGAREQLRSDDGDLLYGVEQKLPLFGKPQLARKVAQAEFAAEQANTTYRFQLLRADLAKAVFKTALASEVVEVGAQDLSWLETMTTAAEGRYQAGQAVLSQVLQLQNERAKRVEQLRSDRNQLVHEQVTLNRLLNRDQDAPWPRLELPSLAASVVYSEKLIYFATKYEPKLKMMREQVKQAAAAVDLTRRQRLPDFNVGLEGRTYSGDGSFRQGMLVFSFNLPWGNAGKYRNDIARDEAKRRAVEFDLADYNLSVREEVHRLTILIDAARREALLYRDEIIPRSEQALQSALPAWESGTGTFRDVLDARRMLLDARLMYARAISEQYQMLSELVLCCGLGDLEALQMLDKVSPSTPESKSRLQAPEQRTPVDQSKSQPKNKNEK